MDFRREGHVGGFYQALRPFGGQSPVRAGDDNEEGHDRLVVISAKEYRRLKRRDRQVIRVGELTDEEAALIEQAEVPARYGHLDDELKDWRP